MSPIPAAAIMAALASTSAVAAQIEQSITLTNGWNAVYVSVAPSASADEVFADWPTWSVSAYNADAFLHTSSTEGGRTGEGVVRAPFWIWSRESSAGSTLKTLQADTERVARGLPRGGGRVALLHQRARRIVPAPTPAREGHEAGVSERRVGCVLDRYARKRLVWAALHHAARRD